MQTQILNQLNLRTHLLFGIGLVHCRGRGLCAPSQLVNDIYSTQQNQKICETILVGINK